MKIQAVVHFICSTQKPSRQKSYSDRQPHYEHRVEMEGSGYMAMQQLMNGSQRPAPGTEQSGHLMKKTARIEVVTAGLEKEKQEQNQA